MDLGGEALLDLGSLDALSAGESPVHRLEGRVKLLATLLFAAVVASFSPREVSGLVPLTLFPVAMGALAGVPARLVLRKLLVALPFVALIGLFNPLLDREVVGRIGPVAVTGGWLSLTSILLKFLLTASAALVLVATTGVAGVASALSGLGAPRALVVPLFLVHRYLFVLLEDGLRMERAREVRTFGDRGRGLGPTGALLGSLLLRTWERAERVHLAMRARGFDGRFATGRARRPGPWDLAFLAVSASAFLACRRWDVPVLLGRVLAGGAG